MNANVTEQQVSAALTRCVGLTILDVSFGGLAGSSFSLSLGAGLPQRQGLGAVSEKFGQAQGNHNIYVWCSWRFESGEQLASSAQEAKVFGPMLASLIGKKLTAAHAFGALRDVRFETANARLDVFCDRVPPSEQGNWDLTFPGGTLAIGPGLEVELES